MFKLQSLFVVFEIMVNVNRDRVTVGVRCVCFYGDKHPYLNITKGRHTLVILKALAYRCNVFKIIDSKAYECLSL